MVKRLQNKGFSILNHVYTNREIRTVSRLIYNYFKENDDTSFGKRTLLKDIPELKPILFNKNLKQIIGAIDPKAFLSKAIFFDKPPNSNWYVTWHQDVPINVTQKIELEGFSGWTQKKGVISVRPPVEVVKNIFTIRIHLDETNLRNGALKVVPGSHNKILTDTEIQTISSNSYPFVCEIASGGIQIMKPLLLHSSPKAKVKKRKVIHLEFTSYELPDRIDWLERENVLN